MEGIVNGVYNATSQFLNNSGLVESFQPNSLEEYIVVRNTAFIVGFLGLIAMGMSLFCMAKEPTLKERVKEKLGSNPTVDIIIQKEIAENLYHFQTRTAPQKMEKAIADFTRRAQIQMQKEVEEYVKKLNAEYPKKRRAELKKIYEEKGAEAFYQSVLDGMTYTASI